MMVTSSDHDRQHVMPKPAVASLFQLDQVDQVISHINIDGEEPQLTWGLPEGKINSRDLSSEAPSRMTLDTS